MSPTEPKTSSQKHHTHDPLLGHVVGGKFLLRRKLGQGGMGMVYEAQQASLERSVAIKLLFDVEGNANKGQDLFDDSQDSDAINEQKALEEKREEFRQRFLLEAKASAKLRHPNIITIFDYGSAQILEQPALYIAMELVSGCNLSQMLDAVGALPTLRAVRMGMQICRALQCAHTAGIVHRDLKPGNIMVDTGLSRDDEDFIKVLDFGLAKAVRHAGEGLTKSGSFLGSPRYVAPEQINGLPVDARADIYSLGCILYRMIVGKPPFDGTTAASILRQHLNSAPPSLPAALVPPSLRLLVDACLAKNPQDRPASMEQALHLLRQAETTLLVGKNSHIPTALPPPLPSDIENVDASASASAPAPLKNVAGHISGHISGQLAGQLAGRDKAQQAHAAAGRATNTPTSTPTSTPSVSLRDLNESWPGKDDTHSTYAPKSVVRRGDKLPWLLAASTLTAVASLAVYLGRFNPTQNEADHDHDGIEGGSIAHFVGHAPENNDVNNNNGNNNTNGNASSNAGNNASNNAGAGNVAADSNGAGNTKQNSGQPIAAPSVSPIKVVESRENPLAKTTLWLRVSPAGAKVEELIGDEHVFLGHAPVSLPWQVKGTTDVAASRVFMVSLPGYKTARVVVPPPAAADDRPRRLEVSVKLVAESR